MLLKSGFSLQVICAPGSSAPTTYTYSLMAIYYLKKLDRQPCFISGSFIIHRLAAAAAAAVIAAENVIWS